MNSISNKKPNQPIENYWNTLIQYYSYATKIWLEEHKNLDLDTKHYRTKKIKLTKRLTTKITEFSKVTSISIITFLHGAWGFLLNKLASADDVMFYSDYNTHSLLPIRSTLNHEQIVLTLLAETQENLIYNRLNEASFTPLDEALYYALITKRKTKLPPKLTLALRCSRDAFPELELVFADNFFNIKSINKIIAHFTLLIEKMIQNSDHATTYFPIITRKERELLLKKWNTNIPHSEKELTPTHELFSDIAKKLPTHNAVTHKATKLNYQELDKLSNKIANYLLQKKIKPGDLVAVLMERSPILIAAMLGIFKAGAILVPIDPKNSEEEIEFILDDCNTHLILASQMKCVPKSLLYKSVLFNENLSEIKNTSDQFKKIALPLNAPAYVIYSSKTTRITKGVIVTHESLSNLITLYKSTFTVTADDKASQFSSQGFDEFFCETVPYLTLGASIHIIDDNAKFIPSVFIPWLAEHKITICNVPTAYGQILLNMSWPVQLSLRILKISGESLAHYPTRTYPFDIWITYGSAETTIEAACYKLSTANVAQEKKDIPPLGKPVPNAEMYIVNHNMELVPIGCVGELFIGGKVVAEGYLNRTQLTKKNFVRNFFSNHPNQKLFRTGDLAKWRDDGNLEYIGRIEHKAEIKGYRIELNKITSLLREHPDVNEAFVLTRKLPNNEKAIVAYLVPNLDKIRIPYQVSCLLDLGDNIYIQSMTDDISKEGLAISGLTVPLKLKSILRIYLKLPGSNESTWLIGKTIWQSGQRAGIRFETISSQKSLLDQSIEYYLCSHNLMETIKNSATKRSLRKSLSKSLPEYMIPSAFSVLPQFPLNFNGKIDWKALPPPQDFDQLIQRNFVEFRTPTEKQLTEIWCNLLNLNIDQISMTDNFYSLGGNSLLVAKLFLKIIEKYHILIPEKILLESPFIPILADYIDSKGKVTKKEISVLNEIQHDAILPDQIIPSGKLNTGPGVNILLTGAAGYLGIFILRELLQNTSAKIYCLIRKNNFSSSLDRLIANIDRYELGGDINLADRRIIILTADAGADQFGLSIDQYNQLAEKIDLVYHCGAQNNLIASYTSLRHDNIASTLEIIKFSTYKKDKAIHYISTLCATSKKDERGHFIEDFPDANYSELSSGYAISKWVSERLLFQIKNRGLPVTIYRLGNIFGSTETGIINTNDSLLFLIKSCIQLKIAPNWKTKISVVPVDYLSKILVNVSLSSLAKNNVFHITHPKGLMWIDFIAWLNHFGYPVRLVSHHRWLKSLLTIDPDNALYPLLPRYIIREEEPIQVKIDMTHTLQILKTLHLLPFPELSHDLFALYLSYLNRIGFIPVSLHNQTLLSKTSY